MGKEEEENRDAFDCPDLCPIIPDDQRYLRFQVFIRSLVAKVWNGIPKTVNLRSCGIFPMDESQGLGQV